MRYKVGDRVRVKSGLEHYQKCGDFYFNGTDGMDKWLGKIMTIGIVDRDHYHMKEDNRSWAWAEEMLEAVTAHSCIDEFESLLAMDKIKIDYGRAMRPPSFVSIGGYGAGKSWPEKKAYGDCGNSELLSKLGIKKVVFSKKLGRAVTFIQLKDGRTGRATQSKDDCPDWQIGFGQAYFKALVGKERFKTLVGWIEKKGKYIKGEGK